MMQMAGEYASVRMDARQRRKRRIFTTAFVQKILSGWRKRVRAEAKWREIRWDIMAMAELRP